ncbi:type II toxin-antitoxin system VapC family toxin [Mycolicibacter sp. MYC123]|uniref:Ribonuclease VapC n=1 Tax=[Mycobacterium] zoologicum TaxID=2872311 RepID=A0ABU5YNM5_9MYCO|nr:type II toxin-antitoxin system VapC family toxin [Mycolicibacter sp. MYC123]MEB3051672.1 type II toxin-antitoxin system VapC family toxin [Mycolicibacter sp. MYC123]
MIYMDTSALVKLIVQEPKSAALRRWLADVEDRDHVTSAVGRVELMRTALRGGDTEIVDNAQRILDEDLDIMAVTDDVIAKAELIGPTALRALDAIHLASAAQLGDALTAVVVYDHRLIEGCRNLGYRIESPGVVT